MRSSRSLSRRTPLLPPVACPSCHGRLFEDDQGAVCGGCEGTYTNRSDGVLDLTPSGSRYADYMSIDEQAFESWLNGPAETEAAGARHMTLNYLVPLLRSLGLRGKARVLSAGCGGGWDVESLREAGFAAWGIDNGSRTRVWRDRSCADQLYLADAMQMPFDDNSFDFVLSEGVIEHIGFVGDSADRHPNWQVQRQRFAASLLQVTKPGGYVLVACPNRLFPIDFFHGGRPIAGLRLRPHLPTEDFLLSYRDICSLFRGLSADVKPLPLRGFFNLERLAETGRPMTVVVGITKFGLRCLPDPFWGTAFSPYLAVLVRSSGQV